MSNLIRDAADVKRWDEEVDVLVVGLGAAGAAASLEAAAQGAETLVLEGASGGGGTSAMSGGVIYLGGGTGLQRACGFEDSAEEMFKYLMASSGDAPDEAKRHPPVLVNRFFVFCRTFSKEFSKGFDFLKIFRP